MADYPATIATFRTIENLPTQPYNVDNKTTLYTEDIQRLRDEIIAIETTLGAQFDKIYPVGKIIEFGDSTATPESRGMAGTWARHCEGFAHVGYKTGDADFGTVNGTTGAKKHTHELAGTGYANIAGEGNYLYMERANGPSINQNHQQGGFTSAAFTTHYTVYKATLSGATRAGNSIQPSSVVVCWQRTA